MSSRFFPSSIPGNLRLGLGGAALGNLFKSVPGTQVQALMEQMKGFHWMFSYGNYLRETGYALRKLGVGFLNVSAPPAPA